ncbi:olfactory receptor 6N2-like [Dicentrarchus labrax]|uniref:olfactory receptor 6N2-like n=1 Tax=Dicentrarchus labrax TaxID=13489 RepID=UPI0021F622EA|nr:olfactory receptor 6N2-like [Dicentrarchus labrax]
MDDKLNVTYITLDGHVEVGKYRYLYFLVMLTVYILIICCSFTIVGLIWRHNNLHEPMYIFIAALLLNSVVFSTAMYPKLLIDFLSEKQMISYSACLFQLFLSYSLRGSEFFLLAAMAYDRYVSICKPLQYPTIMTTTTVRIFLALAWLVPACLVAVPIILSADMKLCKFTLKEILCNNSIYSLHCVTSKVIYNYGIFGVLSLGLLPLLFILFTYTRIFVICYRSCGNVRKKAAQTCLPHLLVLISFSCLCSYDIIIGRVGSDFPKIVRLIMTLQALLYHPLFNPIIYGLKMKEISKHLKRLFCQSNAILCIKSDVRVIVLIKSYK